MGGVQKTSLILFFLSAVIFASCSDMLASHEESSSVRGCETGSVVFTGTISVSGALPASLNETLNQGDRNNASGRVQGDSSSQGASRSALPSITIGDDYYYYVTATKTDGSETVSRNTPSDFDTTNGVTFALTLTNGNWKIEAGIKEANVSGTAGADDVSVMSETYPVTISTANPVVNHTFYPKPSQEGSGNVALNISYDSGKVDSVTAKCGNKSWTVSTSGTPATIEMDAIASGTYDLSIYFYKNDENGNSILVYSTVQTINVFDNMLTNSWVSDGSGLISDSGVFNLTSALITQFARTTFYVGSTSVGAASNDTGNGSPYAPFETVNKAVEVIAATGDISKDYRIFISGELSGSAEITPPFNGKANSLTLAGLNGLDSNGEPKDSLIDSTEKVLSVMTKVPVTIKNLAIKGGTTGLSVGPDDTNVVIESGVLITDCKQGACVHSGASLTMKGGKISGNVGIAKGAGVQTDNDTSFTFEGGEISENEATGNGGGVYIANSATFTMTGGTIKKNKAASGAGIYNSAENTAPSSSITNGTITENEASEKGGGICNENHSVLTVTGGEISKNTAPLGGAILVNYATLFIGGNAYIPYGDKNGSTGAGKNDICLEKNGSWDSYITLSSGLSKHGKSNPIAVTHSDWKRGKIIVQAGTNVPDLTPYSDYFTYTQDGWSSKVSTDLKSIYIDMPIYVAGTAPERTVCAKDGSDLTGDGTKGAPYATIAKAIELLTDMNTDYTIYIDGTISGAQTIPDTLKKDGNGTYNAQSLTIEGVNGLDSSTQEPNDVLDGNENGTTLTINSNVPVTITKLKIINGTGEHGGGIYISSRDASLALGDGALVTQNTAEYGGGIYNLGKLFLYGTAMVGMQTNSVATSDNWGNKATEGGAGIYVSTEGQIYLGYSSWTNESDNTLAPLTGGVCGNYKANITDDDPMVAALMADIRGGGGIYLSGSTNTAKIEIASGNISYNYAANGAGIYSSGNVTMTGGTIEGNEGNSADTTNGKGGGLYLSTYSIGSGSYRTFTMSGSAVIENNKNIARGAGVYLSNEYCTFEMNGGEISGNTALSNGGAVYLNNGPSFNIQRKANIPYGGEANNNDIYMRYSKIKITAPLSERDADNVIGLTPSSYTERTLLEAGSGVTLANEVGKFTVTQYVSGSIRKDYSLDSEGKLCEGLSLPSSADGLVSGKTYSVTDSSDMQKLADFSSNGCDFNGVTLKLGADITINSAWTPIGNETAFRGTFDGNEKTVTFEPMAIAEAVFGTVGGTVKNLKVAGSTNVAGIAKEANGASALIENCESSAAVISSAQYCAGIVAEVSGATIKGCVNKGTVNSTYVTELTAGINSKGAGGITGPVINGGVVDSCTNTGSVTAGLGAGGISSHISSTCTIRNSQNSGDITSTSRYAGGIVGVASGSGNTASHIDNCFNSGSVTASGTTATVYAGGIAGVLGWGSVAWAQNCLNIGNVSLSPSAASGSYAGALFGCKDSNAKIDYCYYKEGCAGSSVGTGGSTGDTENECIKATQSGSSNAVISAAVTFNGTTYSVDSSTVLSLLNAWVSANSTDGLYLEWETDSNHWPKLKAGQ